MNFTNMRKSNCKLCDGRGVVSCIKGRHEYARACDCKAGSEQINSKLEKYKPLSDVLLFPLDMVLTEKEQAIYDNLKKGKNFKQIIKDICPW